MVDVAPARRFSGFAELYDIARPTPPSELVDLLTDWSTVAHPDVVDLGAFMRAYGLQGLLLKERSARAVEECLRFLDENRERVIEAFARAQADLGWERLLNEHGSAFVARM